VLPAELLQVSYAGELREYLARSYSHLTIGTFRKLVFKGIQQETVLLMGERSSAGSGDISFVELESLDDLESFDLHGGETQKLDHGREKWTQYYLTRSELGLIRSIESSSDFTTLGSLASVDVGIVTGRNEFFVLSEPEAIRLGLTDYCIRLVGRSAHIPGLRLTDEDWRLLSASGGRCLLLCLPDVARDELPPRALDYLAFGEQSGFHEGYKCRIRLPRWWNLPSLWVPDAFLLRQIHDGPRIVENEAAATCTDTIHRLRLKHGVSSRALAASSMNSLTFAFSEIRGRSYGGGVLELEPTEAEALPFPRPRTLPFDDLDLWAQRKPADQVLAEVDRLVLEPAGLESVDVEVLRGIWRKLFERRMRRKLRPVGR